MTVSNNFRVDIRPYSGYDDPSLPIASWVAQGGSAGDASGGTVIMNFFLQRDGEAQISELFNIESLSLDTSTQTARNFSLETLNMDSLAPNRPLTDQIWGGATLSLAHIGFAAIDIQRDTKVGLPKWIGTPNRVEGDAGIRVVWENINLLLYLVTLQGYMWSPRSVLASGGPRRPIDGLYGP